MKISDLLSMCLRSLWRRKVRTLLTVFGVIIGTCSIVVMISLGVGISEQQLAWIGEMGDLTIITVYRNWENEDVNLDEDAVKTIRALGDVQGATPFFYMDTWSVVLQFKERYRYQGTVYGVDMQSLEALGYTVSDGRMPREGDKENIMLFGSQAAYQFMDVKRKRNNYVDPNPDANGIIKDPFVDPMRDKMTFNFTNDDEAYDYATIPNKVGAEKLDVIGILQPDEANNYQFDKQYTVYMDINYAKKLLKEYYKYNGMRYQEPTSYDQVFVKASSVDTVEVVETAIKDMGYETYSMNSIRDSIMEQMQIIQLVLGGLGAVSMLVAALGIANTMIMSIYERTREIGVMKVIGCKIANIRSLFLWEAGMIGLMGGVAGIGISFGLSVVLNILLAGYGGYYGTKLSIIPFWLVALGMAFACGVGLLSGLYPANRAVKISALEAIRHD